MKKSIVGLLALAGLACCAQAQVVISAIYGGGSSTSTTFLSEFAYDFVEIKNNGTTAATLNGWSLQYESATGNGAWAGKINLPNITIPAGGYYLVRTENQTGTCGAGAPCRPVPADFIATSGAGGSGTIGLAATAGKVALVSNQTLLNSDCPVGLAQVVDLIGYGNGSTAGQPVTNCAETAPTNNIGNQFVIARVDQGCIDTGNNFTDTVVLGDSLNNPADDFTPRNASSAPYLCTGACPADCDNDLVCDRDEINANGGVGGIGGTLDCNSNGQLDSCEILSNPQVDCDGNQIIDSCELDSSTDCNANGQLDICEIFGNPALRDCNNNFVLDACEINAAGGVNGVGGTLDCDSTGRLDACERAENPGFFDSNSNGISDGCETPGPGQDCNGNNRIDAWDLATFVLTDVNANGIPDTCEGAVYVEVTDNATVTPAGVRADPNNARFANVQGINNAANTSYAGLRVDNAAVMSGLGAANAGQVYLRLVQSNAAFTNSGTAAGNDIEIFHTNNDTISFVAGTAGTDFDNFATDFADRQSALQYDFTRGTNPPVFGAATGSGTVEAYKLFDISGSNSAGGTAIANELNSRAGTLTIVLNTIPGAGDGTSATYAGWDNLTGQLFAANGPALVVFPAAGLVCDSIDFNNDGSLFDPTDIDAFLSVFSEGPCIPETATCNDIDFNNDTSLFDPCDIDSFLLVFSEGPCTGCGQ